MNLKAIARRFNPWKRAAELELLCKPCNAVHALELKHGHLPFRVIWEGKPDVA